MICFAAFPLFCAKLNASARVHLIIPLTIFGIVENNSPTELSSMSVIFSKCFFGITSEWPVSIGYLSKIATYLEFS